MIQYGNPWNGPNDIVQVTSLTTYTNMAIHTITQELITFLETKKMPCGLLSGGAHETQLRQT